MSDPGNYSEFFSEQNIIPDPGASGEVHEITAWTDITGKPTTLAGFGITDAQPLDSELTAIAALTTTAFGRGLLTETDASTTRTTLGATTVGGNLFTLTNPGAITFLRLNADNTVSTLTASAFRTAAGLEIGTNVLAYDADLSTLAGRLTWAGSDLTISTTNIALDGAMSAGTFTGSGTGLTSIPAEQLTGDIDDARLDDGLQQLAYEALAETYFATVTVDVTERQRINQCLKTLDDAGLLDDLVDAAFLRTGQTNAALQSLKLATPTITSAPVLRGDGLKFDGTDDIVRWTVADTKTGSVAVSYQGAATGQGGNANIFTLCAAAGLTTAANISLGYSSASGLYYTRQGGTVTTSSSIGGSGSALGMSSNDSWHHTFIGTNDNAASPTIKGYIDGVLLLTDSSGLTQVTSAITTFAIGARPLTSNTEDIFNVGKYMAWMIFSKVLSDAEADAVTLAMRWLDPSPVNVVFEGDSTTAHLASKPTDNWPFQYRALPGVAGSGRFYNMANNGFSAASIDSNYSTNIHPLRPRGPVKEAHLYLQGGINDIDGGATGAATYASLLSIMGKAKVDGFIVHIFDMIPGSGFTSGENTHRLTVNTSIAANTVADSIFFQSRLFPDPTDTTFYLDGLHLNLVGNTAIANALAYGGRIINREPKYVQLTDAATIATDASLVPNGGICQVTLTDNRTLGAPTNPTHGQRIMYRFKQDGTGNRTLSLNAVFVVGPHTVTLSTAANAVDYMEVAYNVVEAQWDVLSFTKGY